MIDATEEQLSEFLEELEDLDKGMRVSGVIDSKGEIHPGRVHGFYQHNVDLYIKIDPNGVACEKGCFYCCYLNVDLFPGEIQYILDRYRKEYGTHRYEEVVAKAEARHFLTKDKPVEEQRQIKKACPFLQGTLCTIYEYRPYSCRSMNVAEKEPCKVSFETGVDQETPFLSRPKILQAMMSIVLLKYHKKLSMRDAMMEALSDQDHTWIPMQQAIVEYNQKLEETV